MESHLITGALIAVASMVIDFTWFSLKVFGKSWMQEVGLSTEDIASCKGCKNKSSNCC